MLIIEISVISGSEKPDFVIGVHTGTSTMRMQEYNIKINKAVV
ncbi:MAG: hypothetical protein WAT71_00370 [Ignavibacteria bacterium]